MDFVTNIIANSMSGFVEAGTRTAGGYAGDALIKAGDLIESAGAGVGKGVESKIGGYGSAIAGQGTVKTSANIPKAGTAQKRATTAGKPSAAPRSYSSPASSKPTSGTPIGTKKYTDSGKKIASTTTGIKKPGLPAAKTNGPTPFPKTNTAKSMPKPYPNNVPYGTKTESSKATSSASNAAKKPANSLPKAYPGTSASKPEPKPYPGTTTYPGSEKKTAVKPRKYKAAEPYKPPVKAGEEMKFV